MAWWLSWLERRPVTAEVVGSSPIQVVKTSLILVFILDKTRVLLYIKIRE